MLTLFSLPLYLYLSSCSLPVVLSHTNERRQLLCLYVSVQRIAETHKINEWEWIYYHLFVELWWYIFHSIHSAAYHLLWTWTFPLCHFCRLKLNSGCDWISRKEIFPCINLFNFGPEKYVRKRESRREAWEFTQIENYLLMLVLFECKR